MSNKRFVYYFAEKSWIIVHLMISESKMQLQGRLSENVIYPKRFPLLPTADKDITGPALPLTFDVLWSEIYSISDIQSSSKFIRSTCKTQSFDFSLLIRKVFVVDGLSQKLPFMNHNLWFTTHS